MPMSSRSSATAASILFATAALLAQTPAVKPALNVKMGLWETTSTTNVSGDMPAVDLDKMTPEQKARIQAMMQSMMGPRTTTVKSCLTREKFDDNTFLGQKDLNMACKRTVGTNTATTLDLTETCTGDHPATIHLHFTAASPTSVEGTMKTTTTNNGRKMDVDGTIAAKWLGAECGDVK